METFVTAVHIFAALFMIVVVLLQGGNQGGVSAAFGGGNTQGVFGASGATSFLGKLTYAVAAIFMVTSVSLTVLKGGRVGLSDKLRERVESSNNNEATAPAPVGAGAGAPAEGSASSGAAVDPATSPVGNTSPTEGVTSPAPAESTNPTEGVTSPVPAPAENTKPAEGASSGSTATPAAGSGTSP